MIHVYTGDGKGKTTAAMGLAARALGHGKRVVIVQFLKNGKSGELAPLSAAGATIFSGKAGTKFVSAMTEEEKRATRAMQDEHLRAALALPFDLLILDEACAALRYGLLEEALLRRAVALGKEREIVVTGRDPAPFLLDAADYITRMECVRHPFGRGVPARQGVEY